MLCVGTLWRTSKWCPSGNLTQNNYIFFSFNYLPIVVERRFRDHFTDVIFKTQMDLNNRDHKKLARRCLRSVLVWGCFRKFESYGLTEAYIRQK